MRWQIAAADLRIPQAADGSVYAVAKDEEHRFSKQSQTSIKLLKGLGVEGDAHCGESVQHRSRVARDPSQPNYRQVHLIAVETLMGLQQKGFNVEPAVLGENITTQGIDLLSLPENTHLSIGEKVILTIKGLRNPCLQLNEFQDGLMDSLVGRDEDGKVELKAGVMAVVTEGGEVKPNDKIKVSLPKEPHQPLARI